jgi:DNA-binding response OmpR family regulator
MIKLLVVDDEQGVCDSIKKPFSYIGFTVFTATTAKKALRIFKKEKPNIIFLDILMPDVDGLDLLKEFKDMDPKSIVIMVTAKGDDQTQKKAVELGADEFMTKPFSFDDLRIVALRKIEMLLGRSGYMKKPRILIVDDEEKMRENLKEFITPRYDCEIFEAADAQSAVKTVQEILPDVIFLDIRMPGMSGIEAIEDMKKIDPGSLIIVISAWKSPDVVSRAMDMGAFDYFGKPLDLKHFQERLESALISIGKLIKIK